MFYVARSLRPWQLRKESRCPNDRNLIGYRPFIIRVIVPFLGLSGR
jgi:hypothetical protein